MLIASEHWQGYMKKIVVSSACCIALIIAMVFGWGQVRVQAQADCATLPSTHGLVVADTTLFQTGTHHVWLRLKAADGNPDIKYSIDGPGGTQCNVSVTGSGDAEQWLWLEAPATLNSSGGVVTVQVSGNKAGTDLDCLVITPDQTFAPTDKTDCEPPIDETPPAVAITAPAAGETLSGNVVFSADATDDEGVQSVQFRVNGSPVGSPDSEAPYQISWDSTQVADGSYTITAAATDTSANSNTSAGVTVTVKNTPEVPPDDDDVVPPTVSIVNSNNTTVINENVSIEVEATDDTAIERVEIFANGNLIQTLNASPFIYNWNIRDSSLLNGDYTLTAVAYDTADNQTTSSPKIVRIRHPDLNRNGTVDIFDLSMMLARWSAVNDTSVDLNTDGTVSIFDLSILLSSWGN